MARELLMSHREILEVGAKGVVRSRVFIQSWCCPIACDPPARDPTVYSAPGCFPLGAAGVVNRPQWRSSLSVTHPVRML